MRVSSLFWVPLKSALIQEMKCNKSLFHVVILALAEQKERNGLSKVGEDIGI